MSPRAYLRTASNNSFIAQLVNEEGLPIIDIVEPVPESEPSVATDAIPASQDPNLIPLWALSLQEKARRRAERERILDILEEEERIQQEKDDTEERERFTADLEKRKQAAEAEMDALKKAREMQKKMGKALLKNLVVAREREEQEARKTEWSKGLAQREDVEKQKKEEEEMRARPFARDRDDVEMNEELKAQERWNDPAAAFLTVGTPRLRSSI